MDALQADELSIQPEKAPGVLSLQWRGRSNARDPGKVLRPYLNEALDATERSHGRLEMHFEKLEHFNSSTISVLIQIINAARERRIRMVISYDGSLKWQTLSFEALQRALQPFEGSQPSSVQIRSV